jgi:hypothetical protein
MRPTEKIENTVKKMNFSAGDEMRKQILDDALKAHGQTKTQPASDKPNIWRIIMKSKSTRLATAAVLFIAAVAGLSILSITSKPAWAIEQTIEVLRHIKAVYLAGQVNYPDKGESTFKIWTRPNRNNPAVSGDLRYQEGDNHVSVASEENNITYVYTESKTGGVVYISEGLNRQCDPFPGSDLFEQCKKRAQNWQEQYRKDEVTGRNSVFVTFEGPAVNTAKYWLIQFDLESKFPVRAGVWWDEHREGKPHYEYSFIEYNPELPADFFEFEVPEGAQVVDCRILRGLLDNNADAGIDVGNMSMEEACKQVAKEYWSVVTAKDWSRLQMIRPLASGEKLNELTGLYANDEPVEVIEIAAINHISDPGTFTEVTCVLKTKSGQRKTSLLNVEIRAEQRGQVGAVAGTIGPELF